MDAGLKAKWVAALRSGEYRQCRGSLIDGASYCCLGVLAIIRNSERGETGSILYPECDVLPEPHQNALIDLNDGDVKRGIREHNFSEIADWIEQNIPADAVEPSQA